MAQKASGVDTGWLFAGLQNLVDFKDAELCHSYWGVANLLWTGGGNRLPDEVSLIDSTSYFRMQLIRTSLYSDTK